MIQNLFSMGKKQLQHVPTKNTAPKLDIASSDCTANLAYRVRKRNFNTNKQQLFQEDCQRLQSLQLCWCNVPKLIPDTQLHSCACRKEKKRLHLSASI